ncbi:integrase/recombinase xerD homolog [Crassostrea virginica]
MSRFLMCSRSDGTTKSYMHSFNRWRKFILQHGHSDIPAQPVHIALYITHLLDNGASYSSVNSAIYSIKWMHEISGHVDPTENSFVKSLQESSKRLTGKPVKRKDPVDSETLQTLCETYKDSTDLLVLRNLTMILIGFAGFLRYDELSSLKCKDVTIESDYLKITIQRSKTDQLREGSEVLISKGFSCACPYSMFLRFLSQAKIDLSSDHFIFKPIFRSSGIAKLIYKNKKLSYTAARQNIVSMLKKVAPHLNIGLHSLRSGGATAAANLGVNERCLQRHGRWKSISSKNIYVKDSIKYRLQVSQKLGL